jgi:serine/threonine-protein kinase
MAASQPPPQRGAQPDQGLDATALASGDDLGATVITPPGSSTARPDDREATITSHNSGDLDATTDDLAQTKPLGQTSTASKPPASNAAPAKPVSRDARSSKTVSQIGDYKIVRKLGKGGMGEVYLAHQISLDRLAALKVLSKQLAGKEDFIKRFYREARAMAKIDHPNVVRVYEVREDRGIHYVAMEFIDGQSLQKWMDQLGRLSIGDAVHVVMRCAEALHCAHEQQMIHRDVKPDNIMLTAKGGVKVSDFGLAKALDEDLSMTQSGTGLGTPYYMAPEQARNAKHVDARADIYALGVTLYYFLTGELPFTGDSTIEVVRNKELGRFTPTRKLNPQISERLDLVIAKMLQKDPVHRFRDCTEFIKALSALGLESPSLSFINAPDKIVVARPPAAAPAPSAISSASKPFVPKTSAEVAAAKDRPASAPESAALWFVQYKNAQGQDAISKFTAAQIVQMLKSGSLDPRGKAKPSATATFLPLTQIAEFERVAQTQMVRVKAETKAHGLRQAYAEIDRQEKWWKFTKKVRNLFTSMIGFVKFLVWLAVVFGTIGAAMYFGPRLLKLTRDKVSEMQKSDDAASPAKPPR